MTQTETLNRNAMINAAIMNLKQASYGTFDVYHLAGPQNAKRRAYIMGQLTGIKVPQAKAGVTARPAAVLSTSTQE